MKEDKKVVLITGASAGMGKVTARRLNDEGYQVYAAARRLEAMQDLAELGVKVVKLDITDYEQSRVVVNEILRTEGRIDVLMNNAGYGSYGVLEKVDDAEARRQFDVNVFGLMHLTRLVLPQMRERRSGKIINVSSIGGRLTAPTGGWYHATKFALEGLSDVLRTEVKQFGIDVVVIQPGNIKSEWAGVAAENLESSLSDGAYGSLESGMLTSLKVGVKETKGWLASAPPETIAAVVSEILKTRRPKTRYVAPFHGKVFLFMRWLLSDKAFDCMMERQIKSLAKTA